MASKNGSATTKLAFTGQLVGVKPVLPKLGSYDGGKPHLELTISIEQPALPQKPGMPWDIKEGNYGAEKLKPRPDDEKEAAAYDKAKAKYEKDLEQWFAACNRKRDALAGYAQLIGLAAVFGNQSFNIVLTPANQDFLPGFAVAALPDPDLQEAEA